MEKTIFTVSEINLASQQLLEEAFSSIFVEGEISNLSRPASGHVYFSLKDQKAQIRAAFFRQYSRNLNFELRNGLLIQVRAKVSLYPDRGDYQLIVDKIELAGEGQLRQAYEALLKKLKLEGLFEPSLKKSLPKVPKKIGVITSGTGAALRDILTVLKRRFPAIPVLIYPVAVQGANAAPEIVKALQIANQNPCCDVLILARGGGSLEDLWPFNEEIVARAIFESEIPIITGVGHETDFTIADFVADVRAATPSAAAECVSPNIQEILSRLQGSIDFFVQFISQRLNFLNQHVDHLLKRLKHPGHLIESGFLRLKTLHPRLLYSMQQILQEKQNRVLSLMRTLDVVSPLATLNRGYAIVTEKTSKKIIKSITELKTANTINIRLTDGEIPVNISET